MRDDLVQLSSIFVDGVKWKVGDLLWYKSTTVYLVAIHCHRASRRVEFLTVDSPDNPLEPHSAGALSRLPENQQDNQVSVQLAKGAYPKLEEKTARLKARKQRAAAEPPAPLDDSTSRKRNQPDRFVFDEAQANPVKKSRKGSKATKKRPRPKEHPKPEVQNANHPAAPPCAGTNSLNLSLTRSFTNLPLPRSCSRAPKRMTSLEKTNATSSRNPSADAMAPPRTPAPKCFSRRTPFRRSSSPSSRRTLLSRRTPLRLCTSLSGDTPSTPFSSSTPGPRHPSSHNTSRSQRSTFLNSPRRLLRLSSLRSSQSNQCPSRLKP